MRSRLGHSSVSRFKAAQLSGVLCLYFILNAGSFSERLLSEQLRLSVEITFSVLVPRFSVEPFHLAVLQTPLVGTWPQSGRGWVWVQWKEPCLCHLLSLRQNRWPSIPEKSSCVLWMKRYVYSSTSSRMLLTLCKTSYKCLVLRCLHLGRFRTVCGWFALAPICL